MLKTFFVVDENLESFGRQVNNLLDQIQNDKENKLGFFNKIVDIQYQSQRAFTAIVHNYYSVMIVVDYFKDELSRDLAYSKSGINDYVEFGVND